MILDERDSQPIPTADPMHDVLQTIMQTARELANGFQLDPNSPVSEISSSTTLDPTVFPHLEGLNNPAGFTFRVRNFNSPFLRSEISDTNSLIVLAFENGREIPKEIRLGIYDDKNGLIAHSTNSEWVFNWINDLFGRMLIKGGVDPVIPVSDTPKSLRKSINGINEDGFYLVDTEFVELLDVDIAHLKYDDRNIEPLARMILTSPDAATHAARELMLIFANEPLDTSLFERALLFCKKYFLVEKQGNGNQKKQVLAKHADYAVLEELNSILESRGNYEGNRISIQKLDADPHLREVYYGLLHASKYIKGPEDLQDRDYYLANAKTPYELLHV